MFKTGLVLYNSLQDKYQPKNKSYMIPAQGDSLAIVQKSKTLTDVTRTVVLQWLCLQLNALIVFILYVPYISDVFCHSDSVVSWLFQGKS